VSAESGGSAHVAALEVESPSPATDAEPNGTQQLPLSSSVQDFCRRHGLFSILQTAERLAKECFHPLRLEIEVEQDPESGEQWLVVRATIRKGVTERREAYSQYTSRWVQAVPWPALFLIRISYDVI
jgi:hypothetical protein